MLNVFIDGDFMILDIFGIDHVLTPSSQGQENNFNAPSGSDGSNMIKHDQTTPQRSIKLWQFLISDTNWHATFAQMFVLVPRVALTVCTCITHASWLYGA